MLFTDVSTERAVRALEKAGFQVVRQGKYVVLSDGERLVTVLVQPTSDCLTPSLESDMLRRY